MRSRFTGGLAKEERRFSNRLAAAIHQNADETSVATQAHAQVDALPNADEAIKASLHASVDEILNSRTLDVEVTFLTGVPDIAALCLEGHVTRQIAIEACANTALLIAGFSAAVNYRWDLFVKATQNGRVHQLSAGPGFGAHVNFETALLGGPTNFPYQATWIDAKASMEYVYWLAQHFGFTLELDIGASYFLLAKSPEDNRLAPKVKFSFGLAF